MQFQNMWEGLYAPISVGMRSFSRGVKPHIRSSPRTDQPNLDLTESRNEVWNMSFQPLPRLLVASALMFAAVTGWCASKSNLATLGENTYAITRTATTGFDRDVAKFKNEAEQDAAKFCADKGKVMKIISFTSDRPHLGGGYTWAKITFKALDAGDPGLQAAEATPAVVAPPGETHVNSTFPTYAGDLYTEILKLDDLRKRGLLTDKEFEQQKKRLLKNAK